MTTKKPAIPMQRHDTDTGSPEVQIHFLSEEIKMLQDHLISHPKDYDAKRGLLKKVAKRRRSLKYLKETDVAAYAAVAKKMGLKV
jgi:small subunit ribosomal protein S15